MSKIDVKAAYRNIPVRPEDWGLLGMIWKDEFYFDKVLPFGLGSSCSLWEDFSNALEWIVSKECNIKTITHYIDDCFVASRANPTYAKAQLKLILAVYKVLGVPVALNKLNEPCTALDYLGIIIDSFTMTARLSDERLNAIQTALTEWQHRKTCDLRDLQSLIGVLNFAAKVVRPGRIFLRRMLDLLAATSNISSKTIALSDGFRSDVKWWLNFVQQWNGVSVLYELEWQEATSELCIDTTSIPSGGRLNHQPTPPTSDSSGYSGEQITTPTPSSDDGSIQPSSNSGCDSKECGEIVQRYMQLHTDACERGGGAVCGSAWWSYAWSEQQIQYSTRVRSFLERESKIVLTDESKTTSNIKRRSMPYLELLALVMAAATWGGNWNGKRILFHNDCEPVVAAVNKGSSKSPLLMGLIRSLHFIAAQHQFEFRLQHIPGVRNVNADLLSRGQVDVFLNSNPNVDRLPTLPLPLPTHDW
jgi:hypothetical protein